MDKFFNREDCNLTSSKFQSPLHRGAMVLLSNLYLLQADLFAHIHRYFDNINSILERVDLRFFTGNESLYTKHFVLPM